MRTTLILNDEVVRAAKRAAAEQQTTLSSVVNDALQAVLLSSGTRAQEAPFRMPVFSGDGKSTDTSPGEITALADEDDLASFTE